MWTGHSLFPLPLPAHCPFPLGCVPWEANLTDCIIQDPSQWLLTGFVVGRHHGEIRWREKRKVRIVLFLLCWATFWAWFLSQGHSFSPGPGYYSLFAPSGLEVITASHSCQLQGASPSQASQTFVYVFTKLPASNFFWVCHASRQDPHLATRSYCSWQITCTYPNIACPQSSERR